jgi:hypothetical protein
LIVDPMKARREARWALMLLACGIVLTFAEGFAGRAPIVRDFVGFTYPSRAEARALFAGGELASWNPLAELGLSRMAAPVHGALYPGHVFLLAGQLETGVLLTWLVHVAWAGLGGYFLARVLGARPFAAVMSGAVWAIGGYAVSMWWNGEKVLTSAWLPWFALGIERATAARALLSPWGALAAIAASMVCYAGDPFLLLHGGALALTVVWARPPAEGWRTRLAELARGAMAMVLGVGLAAPALLCAAYLRGDTARNEPLALGMAEAWSLHPARLAELSLPGWFGNPFDVAHYPGAAFADDPARQALPWAVSVYAGAAFVAFAPCLRSRRVLAAMGGGAALFLLLACGRHTPLNAFFCQIVPGLSLFRYPEKHLVVVVGLFGLLASLGAEEAFSGRAKAWRLLPGPFLVSVVALAFGPSALRTNGVQGAAHVGLAALLLAGCVHLTRTRSAWAFVAAFVAVVDLAVAGRPFLRWAERPLFVSPFADLLTARLGGPPPRIYRPRSGDFEDPATMPGSAGQIFGFATLPGHDPASSLRLGTVLKRLADNPRRLAELLALDGLLLPSDVAVAATPAASLRGTSLYLLARPARVWMVASAKPLPTAEALGAIAADAFDPYGQAIVAPESAPAVVHLMAAAQGSAGACAITDYERGHVDVVCDARHDGLLVLSELYAEGWSVAVDAQESPLLPVNLVLRGVVVGRGLHRITMRYEAPGLVEGALLAAASGLLLLLGLLLVRSRPAPIHTMDPPGRASPT